MPASHSQGRRCGGSFHSGVITQRRTGVLSRDDAALHERSNVARPRLSARFRLSFDSVEGGRSCLDDGQSVLWMLWNGCAWRTMRALTLSYRVAGPSDGHLIYILLAS